MMTEEDCVSYGINPDVYVVSKINSLRLHICLYVPASLTLLCCYRVNPSLGQGICGSTRSFAVSEDDYEDYKQFLQLAIDEYHRRHEVGVSVVVIYLFIFAI
jgi:hypothetical protein